MVHALRSLLKVRLYRCAHRPELSDHSHAHCLGTGTHRGGRRN
jgi:hypothetical protein